MMPFTRLMRRRRHRCRRPHASPPPLRADSRSASRNRRCPAATRRARCARPPGCTLRAARARRRLADATRRRRAGGGTERRKRVIARRARCRIPGLGSSSNTRPRCAARGSAAPRSICPACPFRSAGFVRYRRSVHWRSSIELPSGCGISARAYAGRNERPPGTFEPFVLQCVERACMSSTSSASSIAQVLSLGRGPSGAFRFSSSAPPSCREFEIESFRPRGLVETRGAR